MLVMRRHTENSYSFLPKYPSEVGSRSEFALAFVIVVFSFLLTMPNYLKRVFANVQRPKVPLL